MATTMMHLLKPLAARVSSINSNTILRPSPTSSQSDHEELISSQVSCHSQGSSKASSPSLAPPRQAEGKENNVQDACVLQLDEEIEPILNQRDAQPGTESEEDDEIVVVAKRDESFKEKFQITTSNGQKTFIGVIIDGDSTKGWTFGRSTMTGIDLLAPSLEGDDRFIGVDDPRASKTHCKIYRSGNSSLCIGDLGSRNGTRVNGQSLWPGEERVIVPGDLISIGTTKIKLMMMSEEEEGRESGEDQLLVQPNKGVELPINNHEDLISCYFCNRNLSKFSLVERSLHINSCAEGEEKNDQVIARELTEGAGGRVIDTVCIVCGKPLDVMSEIQRVNHVNKCLDKNQHGRGSTIASKRKTSSANPPAPTSTTAEAAAEAVKASKKLSTSSSSKGLSSRKKKEAEKESGAGLSSSSSHQKRFTFTKQVSSIVADEKMDYKSDEEVFERDPNLLASKRRLEQESKQIRLEDEVQAKKSIKLDRIESLKQEKLARAQFLGHLASSTAPSTDSTQLRFPSPHRPKIALTRASLLRRKRHYEAHLQFVNELLRATSSNSNEDVDDNNVVIIEDTNEAVVFVENKPPATRSSSSSRIINLNNHTHLAMLENEPKSVIDQVKTECEEQSKHMDRRALLTLLGAAGDDADDETPE